MMSYKRSRLTSMALLAILTISIAAPIFPLTAFARTWRDATGRFQVEAELLDAKGEAVRLKKQDGRVVAVPVGKLSPNDQEFIRGHIADAVAEGVGKVTHVSRQGQHPWITVFTETHTSRIGQAEIVVMLYRLYRGHSLRHIGLEGCTRAAQADAKWFHALPATDRRRRRVAIELLRAGEISSAELMGLVFPDVRVHAVEERVLYEVEMKEASAEKMASCLQEVLLKSSMAPEHQRELAKLPEADRVRYLFEKAEPAVGQLLQVFEKSGKGQIAQAEEMVEALTAAEKRATEVRAGLGEGLDGLRDMKRFFETAHRRSEKMANAADAISRQHPTAPIALIVGAAHTDGVRHYLDQLGRAYVVIAPESLGTQHEPTDLSIESFERKSKGHSVDEGGLGKLLEGDRKPPPVLSEEWFRLGTELRLVCDKIAVAAAGGDRPPKAPEDPPFGLEAEDLNRPLIRVDPASIQRAEDEVLFSVELYPRDRARSQALWARARHSPRDQSEEDDLEEKLLALAKVLKSQTESSSPTAVPGAQTPVVNMTGAVQAYFAEKRETVTSQSVAESI